jgi:hypothetical protein
MKFLHKIGLGGYVIMIIFKILELEVVWFLKFDKLKSKLSWGFFFASMLSPSKFLELVYCFWLEPDKTFGSGLIRVPQSPSSQSASGSSHF